MGRVIFFNLIRFILLIALQGFFLKNMGYYNLAIPFLYILFILLLPFETPNWLLFFLSFLTGLTVDLFYNTLGLNAAACTVLAFVRIAFISITVHRDGFDNEPEPSLGIMGFRWFIFYATVLTFIHHLVLFTFETFSLANLSYTLIRVLFSSMFTILLMVVTELIFFRKKVR
ncbi:MAG: rod shape-determining protein MreD [Daejeonella sp.]